VPRDDCDAHPTSHYSHAKELQTDIVSLACAETLHQGIPHSRMIIFEASAHTAHLEEPDKYRQVVADFMVEIEGI
jgi:pimeloyl-ACP methyl ester carboxylesterase